MEKSLKRPGAISRRAVLAAAGGSAAAVAGLTAGRATASVSPAMSSSLVANGLDYSWGRPRPGVTAGLGYRFVCRYLSYDTSGKDLSPSEAQALIAAGLDIVCVWETSADEALQGYARGAQSARDGQSLALECGMPAGRPIYFAVDFDATPGQQATLDSYFDGVASVLGRGRTGAYGGYYPIQRLFDDGKITWGWQTYAWSGGQWDPRAQLRQVQNGITVDGADCDLDQAWATDFGQWGSTPVSRQSQVVAIGGQGGTQSQVAAIGLDGAVYHTVRATNGTWTGWRPMAGYDGASRFDAGVLSIATMPDSSGSSQIAATGTDGNVYHNIRAANGTWQGWKPMAGYDGASRFNAGTVSLTGMTDGSAQVAATGVDGNIYHNIRAASGTWQGWKPMAGYGGGTFNAGALSLSGVPDGGGSAQIVATGTDGNVYHNIRAASGTWQGWKPMAGYDGASRFNAGAVSITGLTDGSAQLVATGVDGNIYHTVRTVSGTWSGWKPVAGYGGAARFGATAVAITGMSDLSAQIVAVGLDDAVYHNIRAANGTWQGWHPMGGYDGAPTFQCA